MTLPRDTRVPARGRLSCSAPAAALARTLAAGVVGAALVAAPVAAPASAATMVGSTTAPAAVAAVHRDAGVTPDQEPSAQAPTVEELADPSSVAALVNPARPLDPVDYVPAELEVVSPTGDELVPAAAEATRELLAAAAEAGHSLKVESGYRSHARQSELFASYSARYGAEYASQISAEPGTSEHQLGLAVDVGLASGMCALQACFGQTPAGQWVAEHAEDFGFILRYPEGATEATGYSYEPWHLRYLGADIVADFTASRATTYEDYVTNLEAAADLVAEPLPEFLPGQAPLRLDLTEDHDGALLRLPYELTAR